MVFFFGMAAGVAPALQSILKVSSSYYGGTLIFLKFPLMSQPRFIH